jgi:hypothetical protein
MRLQFHSQSISPVGLSQQTLLTSDKPSNELEFSVTPGYAVTLALQQNFAQTPAIHGDESDVQHGHRDKIKANAIGQKGDICAQPHHA